MGGLSRAPAPTPPAPPAPGMLLRPRRPPPPAPPAPASPASPDPELRPAGGTPGTPPGRPASPGALAAPASPGSPGLPGSPVSPGSAQRTPWSARETELLLGTLLQPAVWRALLLDRRQALPTYRRVSAALARQQVRRTPAQCRRRYKFLKDKLRDAQGQPPGPFDAQIRELMGLLGDNGHRRGRRRSPGPGRPPRGRRPAPAAPAEPGKGGGAPGLERAGGRLGHRPVGGGLVGASGREGGGGRASRARPDGPAAFQTSCRRRPPATPTQTRPGRSGSALPRLSLRTPPELPAPRRRFPRSPPHRAARRTTRLSAPRHPRLHRP